MKSKTFDQIESMRQKAVRFLRDVVGDPDKAEEFEAMSPADYAEHKKIRMIENPSDVSGSRFQRSTTTMPRKSYADLQEELKDLKEENADLSDRLDTILDIVSPEEDEDEDDDEEDDDDEDEGDDAGE